MFLRFAIAAAVSLFIGTSATAATMLSTPWIVNPDNGRWYALTVQEHWVPSAVIAITNGGHLATIRSQAEQDFVYQTFQNWGGQQRLLWIGFNDYQNQGQFKWVSGEPVTYTNWAPGEPNNFDGEERFVAVFPESAGAGGWNDFWHLRDAFGYPAYGVVERDPTNPVHYPVHVSTGLDWRVLAPEGNQVGQDLDSVGLAFEAANPAWNSNVAFDTSGWSTATQVAASDAPTFIWAGFDRSPVYFRHTFTLDGPVSEAMMLATVDDNAQIYINGQLVVNDPLGGASAFGPLDVTAYLQVGANLIAVKAQDGGIAASLSIDIFAVPEPSGAVLGLFAAAALLPVASLTAHRRKQSRRRSS
jgi:hypothetical protein